jgi:hypothetical protein
VVGCLGRRSMAFTDGGWREVVCGVAGRRRHAWDRAHPFGMTDRYVVLVEPPYRVHRSACGSASNLSLPATAGMPEKEPGSA